MLHVGLLINPFAGLGGTVALKGSDGVADQAMALGAQAQALPRSRRALKTLASIDGKVRWSTWGGAMGAHALAGIVRRFHILGSTKSPTTAQTTALDTQTAAAALLEAGVDLLLVAGGDGTIRDLLPVVGERVPVLGIPCGVKMHSGVFATTPEQAGALLVRLVEGGLVRAARAEVRDQDESQLRDGAVATRFYGELLVPALGGFLQQTKEGGKENEALAVAEIVAELQEQLTSPAILGPGSTCAAIKEALGMTPTLLGFDVWDGHQQVLVDATAVQLEGWVSNLALAPTLVLSFTRGQGFLVGRGNQQLSPRLVEQLIPEHLTVVATRSKLLTLAGQPLLIDTNDAELDQALNGLIQITVGYDDYLWYQLSDSPNQDQDQNEQQAPQDA